MSKSDAGPSFAGWHSGDETFWRCEQEGVFKHLRRIEKAGKILTPRAMAVGLFFHAGRARWFKEGFPDNAKGWDSIYAAVREEGEKQPLPMPPGAEQEALNILSQYVAHYGKLPKPKVLAAELLIGPVVTFEGSSELHTNRLDDVSEYPDFANALADGEAKTTSGKPSAVYAHYNANHGQLLKQMLVITSAMKAGILKLPKEPIGIVLDVVQKGYGGDKCHFERFLITIEPFQLEWFARDLDRIRRRRRELETREDLLAANKIDDHFYEDSPELEACMHQTGAGIFCGLSKDAHTNIEPPIHRVSGGCRRLVSGDGGQFIAVDCEFMNLCKFGRSAATEYVVNGQPAGAVKGGWWR